MGIKMKCMRTNQPYLTVGKVYEGKDSECGCAFIFNDDNGREVFWTINDYNTFMYMVTE
jgi:hypothetical protein